MTTTTNASALPGYTRIPEPALLFHVERAQDRHIHPLVGLVNHGPYSRSLLQHLADPIRIASITPAGDVGKIDQLLAELATSQRPRERRQYLVEFPGFARVFGLRVVRSQTDTVELGRDLDDELARAERPHLRLAESLVGALGALQARRSEFDLVAILLPQRWEHCFWSDADPDFDLHDYLKAVTAARSIPIQILREDHVLNYPCRCSVLWRLGIAVYTKAGGIPWKLADAEAETAVVGMSYAMRQGDGSAPRFVTCCSQVFDADGGGLEFVAYETQPLESRGDNPYLSRSDMRRVMARSLSLYQRRHGGGSPRRVVVHKTTPFRREERDGCFDAWDVCGDIDLVQIQDFFSWRGIKYDSPTHIERLAKPSAYPCERGLILPLGPRDLLLWTQGDVPDVAGGRHFFKEGKGIPEPLFLTRWAGHRPWSDLASEILGLTKMDWNNDALYNRLPVTLGYAGVLAGVVKRMRTLSPMPYQFRFFM